MTGVAARQQTRRREQDRLPSPSAPLRDCSSVTDASAALIGQFQPASRFDTTPRFIDSRRLSSLDPAAPNFSPCPCETIKVSGSPVSFRHPPPLAPSHLLGRSCGLFGLWPVDTSVPCRSCGGRSRGDIPELLPTPVPFPTQSDTPQHGWSPWPPSGETALICVVRRSASRSGRRTRLASVCPRRISSSACDCST